MGDHIDYRRETRNKRNLYECSSPPTRPVYECPPPPPVVVECSVCRTAESAGRNLWDWLPFVSYPSLVGPTLGDILIHVLNLLPPSVVSWLGIGHQKMCVEDPAVCDESGKGSAKKRNRPNICPPDPYNSCGEGGDELSTWMSKEYAKLAEELAELRRLTDEGQGTDDGEDARFLNHTRHYVLDRLAEMLAKRDEHEKRLKRKNNKCQ